jgi:hypothetical protein
MELQLGGGQLGGPTTDYSLNNAGDGVYNNPSGNHNSTTVPNSTGKRLNGGSVTTGSIMETNFASISNLPRTSASAAPSADSDANNDDFASSIAALGAQAGVQHTSRTLGGMTATSIEDGASFYITGNTPAVSTNQRAAGGDGYLDVDNGADSEEFDC